MDNDIKQFGSLPVDGFFRELDFMIRSPVALITLVCISLSFGSPILTDPTASPTPGTPAPVQSLQPSPIPTRTHVPGSTITLVPGGTTVFVSLLAPLSSATANQGDVVGIQVTKEVDVNGWLVIPKGANGQATVTHVERAGGNGHGGQIGLTFDWVFGSDGEKIQLTNVAANSENGDQKGAASTATIATYVLLGPIGLFAHNFVHGKDVTVQTNQVFNMFLDHDVHIDATQKATPEPGFAQ